MTDADAVATSMAQRLEQLQDRIQRAAASVGRDTSDIRLVAVTKTHPPAAVEVAYNLGLRDFGENRVEEAAEKLPDLSHHTDIEWHMIGHIQSRKAKDAAELFSWIHSVDRLKIARRLDQHAGELGRTLKVLLEVNISGEASKYGFDVCHWPDDTDQYGAFLEAVEMIIGLPNLRVHGLMTMAPYAEDPETARPLFARLTRLRDDLAERYPESSWHHLSTGMTGDFEVAIQEGATMLRIGTAIFGPRNV